MPRHLPSGSQLPQCWNAAMDETICYAEAKGWLDTTRIVRLVKERFSDQLRICIITNEAVERRIACLELRENDYFRGGMQEAIALAEVNGFTISPLDVDTNTPQPGAQCDHGHRRENSMSSGIRMVPHTAGLEGGIQEVANGVESMVTGNVSSSMTPANTSHTAPNVGPTVNDQSNDRPLHNLSNTRTPTTISQASTSFTSPSNASTAISTPANPNFSVPLTGSPSNRKHRPQPLDLTNESHIKADIGRTSSENRGGMGFRNKVMAKMGGKELPRLAPE
ncbi:MAG: hypothetical protein Q9164_005880 [Protoblastenia rupestris]